MSQRIVEVKNPHGLHARPAALFVQKAASFSGKIVVAKGDKEADAKSILGIMSMGIECGDTITLKGEGDQIESVFDALEAIAQDTSL